MSSYRYSALVVDDEEIVRKLTVRALDRRGFICTPASDGTDAARLLATRKYDAIVTDLRMPNGNGYSLAVDQLERADRPLIVILTGVMEPRLAQDLLRRGIDDIMFKPVDYEMFAGKVAGLVERRNTFRAGQARSDLEEMHLTRTSTLHGTEECMPTRANECPDNVPDENQKNGLALDLKPSTPTSAEMDTTANTPDLAKHAAQNQVPNEPDASVAAPQAIASEAIATSCDNSETISPSPPGQLPGPGMVPRAASVTQHDPDGFLTGILRRIAPVLHWRGAVLPWLVAFGMLAFSGWLWLQIQLLQQSNRAILALEQLGARMTVLENGAAAVSFEADRRPTGLDSLAHVPNLRQVSLAQTKVTDEDLESLGVLKDLESLDLRETAITDAGLEQLERLRNLRVLSLRGTRVTNAGVLHLKALHDLRDLSLRDTNVNAAGVQRLQMLMPGTKIDHSSVVPQDPVH